MDSRSHERREWLSGYAVTIAVITTLLLGIRLVSRFNNRGGKLGLDDAFITIGWVLGIADIGYIIKCVQSYKLDRHIWDVPPVDFITLIEKTPIILGLSLMSMMFTKISILLFYRRLVEGTCSRGYKRALWAGITFIVLYSILFVVLFALQCSVVDQEIKLLDPKFKPNTRCVPLEIQGHLQVTTGALNIASDLYSFALPAILLSQIRIAKRQRIGLVFIFGLGLLAIVMSIVRISYLTKIGDLTSDASWITYNTFAAGIAEGSIAIICACAPSLRSCFRAYFKEHMSTRAITQLSKTRTSEKTGKSSMSTKTPVSDVSYEMDVKGPDITVDAEVARDVGSTCERTGEPVGLSGYVGKGAREIYGSHFSTPQPTFYSPDTDDEELSVERLKQGSG